MKIKIIYITVLFLYVFGSSCSQNLKQEELNKKISHCESQFPNEYISKLKKEFNDLESYFVRHGLLKDKSGKSYYEVYNRIAESNSFDFQADTSMTLIDSIDHKLTRTCFFKLLTQDQLNQVTKHHLDVANKLTSGLEGNINLSKIAKRYTELLTPKDFELEYLKLASLLSFYEMSKTQSESLSIFPEYKVENKDYKVLNIELNNNDILLVAGKEVSNKEITELVRNFIEQDPSNRAIEINPSDKASYNKYLSLLDAVNIPINDLREKHAKEMYKTNFAGLNVEQRKIVEELIPRNIIIKEIK